MSQPEGIPDYIIDAEKLYREKKLIEHLMSEWGCIVMCTYQTK